MARTASPKGQTMRSLFALELYKQQGYTRSLRRVAEQLVEERLRVEQEDCIRKGIFPPQITDEKKQKLAQSSFKQVAIWSSEGRWQEVVQQYDREQFEEKKRRREAEIEKMNENHATLGSGMAIKAAQHINELMKDSRFGATAAVMLFKEGSSLERIARGASTEQIAMETIGESSGSKNKLVIDLEKLTTDQLLALERVVREVEETAHD